MRYVGQMPASFLNDQQIRPTEYTKWAHAHDRFRHRPKDRATVDAYKAELEKTGTFRKPIKLGVSDRYPDVYVGDGHHRAVALRELGVETFPFHWYWIRSWGRPDMEQGPFPEHLLEPAKPTAPKRSWF